MRCGARQLVARRATAAPCWRAPHTLQMNPIFLDFVQTILCPSVVLLPEPPHLHNITGPWDAFLPTCALDLTSAAFIPN